ncbi:myosin-IIIb-like [Gigantopelta aegis]|uniref:myosin-IIIb-like n=1 Tax=Gigantopelta aegis TaxID=1735272 RepID=UPI001B88B664|nr:myosin-IIIb-like [Gigantopelta aegis]
MDRPPLGDVEDLATLAKLDEQILLKELKERYKQNKIYTYVGDILIAVNPFQDLQIYGKNESAKYHKSKKSSLPPHIFAIADASYHAMLGLMGHLPCNQCILISGESGAGKTESTKLIIKQLVDLCHGNTQLEQQILQVNPLLEAFGNAQTNMNDNSSRFGKYIQLKFQQDQVMGAKISEYLLEKSRVVRQNEGEENFHIFSYLFAGLTQESSQLFGLGDPHKYRYFSSGISSFKKKLPELQQQYDQLLNAMDLVGFTDEEQGNVFSIIASVLHLGNVTFDTNEHDGAAVTNPNGPVKMMSRLLSIDSEEVQACLTSMVIVTSGEYVKKLYSIEQANDARDAMAKAVYGRVFGWIVNKVNCLLAPEENIPEDQLKEIGILDIFGFEHFEKNSFEQACINLANEQLQFFFNQHIFKMEQEEYKREGIDWNEITFVDNKPLLDMFLQKPIGLLALLDEESKFPKATDQTYVDKVNFHFMKNPYYMKAPSSKVPVFSINHYAGKVTYDATQWLEKNRDTLPTGIMEILQSSKNPLVRTIFRGQISRTGSLALQGRTIRSSKRSRKLAPIMSRKSAAKRKLTVGAQFKNSLNILMEKMTSATPIFVRCLKPNHLKKANTFSDEYILAQLLYTGMLETTKIRREGFAVRPAFEEFVQKYKVIMCQSKLQGTCENCIKILRASKLTGWHVGKTKVFLKYWHIEQLSDILTQMGTSAIHLQRVVRGFLARRRCKRLREKARLQAVEVEKLINMVAELGSMSGTFQSRLVEEDKKRHPKDKMKSGPSPPVPEHPPPRSPAPDYLKPTKTTSSCGTQVEGDSDDDIIEDDFQPILSNKNKFGQPGTRQATAVWFKETQTNHVIDEHSGKFASWFHGIITRRQSEELLKQKIVGCYLIRVSESRFGYTLSFKDVERCRHYMIDQLKNGKFIIKGEPKVHRNLHDIIEYHKKNPISNWDGRLTVPCGQEQGECDYVDLMDGLYFVLEDKKNARQSVAPPPVPQESPGIPHLPPRNYSVQTAALSDPKNRLSNMVGRPLPQLPEQYNRLLENQVEQHKYDPLNHGGRENKRLSTTRNRLH